MGFDAYIYALSKPVRGEARYEPIEDVRLYVDTMTAIHFPTGKAPACLQVRLEMGHWQCQGAFHEQLVSGDTFLGEVKIRLSKSEMNDLQFWAKKQLKKRNREKCFDEDLRQVIAVIAQCFSLPEGFSFEYHASW